MRAWLTTVVVASVALIPLFVVLLSQQSQIAWIWPVGPVTLGQIAGEQYFPSVYSDSVRAVGPDQQQFSAEQLRVAMSAWARVAPLIVVIVILAALAVRARRRHGAPTGNPSGTRVLVRGAVAWIVHANDIEDKCTDGVCPTIAKKSVDGYKATAKVSTISGIVGASLVGAGVVLYLASPERSSQPSAGLAIGPGSLSLQGAF